MWNNRVVITKHEYEIGGETFSEYHATIHEFYYDDEGNIVSHTANPVYEGGCGETAHEAFEDLKMSIRLLQECISRVEDKTFPAIELSNDFEYKDARPHAFIDVLDADDAYMEERYGDPQ